ncbi:MAG TPA: Fe-S-containing protein [Thermoanaerobaculia bacterium]|nr:Fe-S-containing protein [Thermoanaerobaculia bacterium]
MRRFKPVHGIVLVLLFVGVVLLAELAFEGKLASSQMQRVSPDRNGMVRISLAGLQPLQVRFYQFLNAGNQEVHFLVGRDPAGHVAVAFDASEDCAKNKRGFRPEGEWLVCNKCDKAFRLAEVNAGGGGCKPVPLEHQVDGDEVVIAEADILKGWRLFH